MRHATAVLVILAACAPSVAAQATPAQRDTRMDGYLAIWADDAAITPATVARLYAGRVDYYGHRMSADAVYRDKIAFARRWPSRRYAVVPGTVTNDCGDAAAACRVGALLQWSRETRAGRRDSGTNTIRLDLAREGGMLKIVRESGEPVRGGR